MTSFLPYRQCNVITVFAVCHVHVWGTADLLIITECECATRSPSHIVHSYGLEYVLKYQRCILKYAHVNTHT